MEDGAAEMDGRSNGRVREALNTVKNEKKQPVTGDYLIKEGTKHMATSPSRATPEKADASSGRTSPYCPPCRVKMKVAGPKVLSSSYYLKSELNQA